MFAHSMKQTGKGYAEVLFILLTLLLASCAKQPIVTQVNPPTVEAMSHWNIERFNNGNIKYFFDRAGVTDAKFRAHWLPMMKQVVAAKESGRIPKLWIPMSHLEKAVNTFNQTQDFDLQEATVYLYYWQIYKDVSTRVDLYGTAQNEKSKRIYLRKYLPHLFDRHKNDDFEKFKKMYRLVKLHDSELVTDLFHTDPFAG